LRHSNQLREFKCQFARYVPIPGYEQKAIDMGSLESLVSVTIYMSTSIGALALPALVSTNNWKVRHACDVTRRLNGSKPVQG
jgi:hypothetical protein